MILTVWWLGVRRLKGRLPAVGHVPGAGVDGHGDLLAGGHGVGTVAITQSERTLGCCALRFRCRLGAADDCGCAWVRPTLVGDAVWFAADRYQGDGTLPAPGPHTGHHTQELLDCGATPRAV